MLRTGTTTRRGRLRSLLVAFATMAGLLAAAPAPAQAHLGTYVFNLAASQGGLTFETHNHATGLYWQHWLNPGTGYMGFYPETISAVLLTGGWCAYVSHNGGPYLLRRGNNTYPWWSVSGTEYWRTFVC